MPRNKWEAVGTLKVSSASPADTSHRPLARKHAKQTSHKQWVKLCRDVLRSVCNSQNQAPES